MTHPDDELEMDSNYDDHEEDDQVEDDEPKIPRKTREHSRSSSRSSSSRSKGSSGAQATPKPTVTVATGSSSGRSRRRSSSSSSSIKSRSLNVALFFIRVVVSLSMLTWGMKYFELLITNRAQEFGYDPIGLGLSNSLFLTVVAEVFCSILIIVGLFTRIATLPLMITMAVAALGVALNVGFREVEKPLLYFLFYFLLLVTGPGKYSLDRYIKKLRKERFQ